MRLGKYLWSLYMAFCVIHNVTLSWAMHNPSLSNLRCGLIGPIKYWIGNISNDTHFNVLHITMLLIVRCVMAAIWEVQ